MLKLVVKRPPILAPSPKTQVKKNFLKPVLKNLPQSKLYPHKTDPIPPVQNKPVAPKPADTGKPKTEPKRHNNETNTKLAIFDRNVKEMQKEQQKERNNSSTKAAPKFIKPPEQERLKKSLKLADGGKEGAASGDYRVNPKSGVIEPREGKKLNLLGLPKEYSNITDIMGGMPYEFDFTGWDKMSTSQQRSYLQRAGLSGEPLFSLLNASTSLETIAIVQDIERNRVSYGLSLKEVQDISGQLFQIADARIGAKNRELPFLTSPVVTKVFLQTLDEKESELIGPFIDRKGRTDVPHPADNTKKDNRIPLKKGTYIDYNSVDLTDDLNGFMRESAETLKNLQKTARKRNANFTDEFISLVDNGGLLDIKSQEAWKFRQGLTYKFNDQLMRNDDIGNIAFGYYGAAVYGKDFLHFGAGVNQFFSDLRHNKSIQWGGKFFDDPQDYDMIEYGYQLYKEEHPD